MRLQNSRPRPRRADLQLRSGKRSIHCRRALSRCSPDRHRRRFRLYPVDNYHRHSRAQCRRHSVRCCRRDPHHRRPDTFLARRLSRDTVNGLHKGRPRRHRDRVCPRNRSARWRCSRIDLRMDCTQSQTDIVIRDRKGSRQCSRRHHHKRRQYHHLGNPRRYSTEPNHSRRCHRTSRLHCRPGRPNQRKAASYRRSGLAHYTVSPLRHLGRQSRRRTARWRLRSRSCPHRDRRRCRPGSRSGRTMALRKRNRRLTRKNRLQAQIGSLRPHR